MSTDRAKRGPADWRKGPSHPNQPSCLRAPPAPVICPGGMPAFVVGPRAHPGDPGRPPAVSPQSERAGVVAGSVVDGQGAAIRDVTVELLAAGVVVRPAKTNARGEFTFADVAPGTYEVRATRPGLVPSSTRVAVNAL